MSEEPKPVEIVIGKLYRKRRSGRIAEVTGTSEDIWVFFRYRDARPIRNARSMNREKFQRQFDAIV